MKLIGFISMMYPAQADPQKKLEQQVPMTTGLRIGEWLLHACGGSLLGDNVLTSDNSHGDTPFASYCNYRISLSLNYLSKTKTFQPGKN